MGKRAEPAGWPTWLGRLRLIEESSNNEARMPKAEAEWGDLAEEWGLHGQLIGNEVAIFGCLRAALKAQGGVSWRRRFWHDYILAVEWLGVLRSCNQRKGPGLGPRLGWWLLLERKGWDLSGRGVKSREGARFLPPGTAKEVPPCQSRAECPSSPEKSSVGLFWPCPSLGSLVGHTLGNSSWSWHYSTWMRNDLTAQGTFLPSVNQAISLSICWLLCIPEDLSLSETAVWRTRGVTDRAGVTSSSEWLQPWGDLPHLRVPLWGLNWHSSWGLRGRISACCSSCWQFVAVLLFTSIPKCAHCVPVCAQISPSMGSTLCRLRPTLWIMGFFFSGREFNSVKSLYQSSKSSRN